MYTVDEARALLPRVIPLLQRLKTAYIQLRAARASFAADARGVSADGSSLTNPFDDGGEDALGAAATEMEAASKQLDELGIELKDPEQGLIDFNHERQGEVFISALSSGKTIFAGGTAAKPGSQGGARWRCDAKRLAAASWSTYNPAHHAREAAVTAIVPARDIFVDANGLRHHLIARGSPGTPVVLMIHGLAGQAHVFDVIASHLAAKHHVYCLDVRGRGETQWGPADGYTTENYVADLEAVRAALGLQRFALVGTSMGGLISMQYAPRHPERVTAVVLNDIGPEIDPVGLARIIQYVGHAPEMFADLKAVTRYYRENYAPMVEHLPDDQIADFARWNVRRSDSGIYVWKMDPAVRSAAAAPPAIEPWDAVRQIACPLLVLRGEKSDVLSPETARRMVQEAKQASLVEVPGVGHAPVLTEAAAMKALDSFLPQ